MKAPYVLVELWKLHDLPELSTEALMSQKIHQTCPSHPVKSIPLSPILARMSLLDICHSNKCWIQWDDLTLLSSYLVMRLHRSALAFANITASFGSMQVKHLRGWWPTDCNWTPPKPKSYGAHQPAVNIKSRLDQFGSATLQCFQYHKSETSGFIWTWTSSWKHMSLQLWERVSHIWSVRRSLPCHALLTLIRALVVSKVDYCNLVLAGAPGHLLDWLQSVLNGAARLIFSVRKREHITPLLHELHWLRVPDRTKFRLCSGISTSSWHSAIIPHWDSSLKHRRRSSPSRSVPRVTNTLSVVKPSVNSGRPRVSRCITRMEQSASCCQRQAVTAVFPSAFEDITVPIIIPLLTVSPVLSQRFSHWLCKMPLQ